MIVFMEENKESNDEVNKKDSDKVRNTPIKIDGDQSEANKINTDSNKKILDPKKRTVKEDRDSKNNIKKNNASLGNTELPQKKAIPIEKKPFNEFVKAHLIPAIEKEFKQRGFEVEEINLNNTFRPIAGDKCWVINCVIKDTCNFWLSFEKDDISSSKSISLSKPNQKPSIIESFLIDEKRITLILIISRIFQRLNGQKLIGIN